VKARFRDKPVLLYGLARNRRSPKRPSEPRPSGVHLEEAEWGKDGVAYRLGLLESLTRDGLVGEEQCCAW
jgi:hypothetical protein